MYCLLSEKEFRKLADEEDKVKYTCKCGRRVIISNKKDKEVCSWCGRYVFKNKKDEFKYRVKERIKWR